VENEHGDNIWSSENEKSADDKNWGFPEVEGLGRIGVEGGGEGQELPAVDHVCGAAQVL